ncbi:MAG: HD domain-containing phosphohydrolase, partial [Oceanobacter sp.]
NFDLVISDMRMPGMSGAEFLKTCFEKWPEMVRILITGYSDMESTIAAVNEGNIFRYVHKPWDNAQLRSIVADALQVGILKSTNEDLQRRIADQNAELSRLNRELQGRLEVKESEAGAVNEKLESAYRTLVHEFNSMLLLLVGLVERRNGEEQGSTERLARLTKLFGEFAGLVGQQIQDLYYAALLKNIGMITLPDIILTKSLPAMTQAEKREYAHFTINGETTLMMLEPLQNAARIIRSHMELYNGKGFPDRLASDAIPLESRLLRIVTDFVDLQREHNFLGERLEADDAKKYLLKMAGKRYDRELVDLFMEALEDFGEGVVSNVDRIPIEEARVGMSLAGSLVSPAGVTLLSEGTVLNERHVQKLAAMRRQFEGHQIMLHIRRPEEGGESA